MRDAIPAKRSRRLMLVAVGLLAAVAVLPLLVPPSAVAWDLLPLEDRLALESTAISSPMRICWRAARPTIMLASLTWVTRCGLLRLMG